MANIEEINIVLNLLHKNRPIHSYENLMRHDIGILGVVAFLNDSKGEVKSKDISDALKISSARMAVLLKKLETKDLIEKSASTTDARITVVKLSDKGILFANSTKLKLQESAEQLINEFGIEYLVRILSDMNKIKNIMDENMKNSEEILHD